MSMFDWQASSSAAGDADREIVPEFWIPETTEPKLPRQESASLNMGLGRCSKCNNEIILACLALDIETVLCERTKTLVWVEYAHGNPMARPIQRRSAQHAKYAKYAGDADEIVDRSQPSDSTEDHHFE
ncbi:hypothetical protein ColTof3_04927 [Colletotrichum tofieldiae]|nr:hypothetical protein ColTof3_04927 [Colletotrichum tofieldiae]